MENQDRQITGLGWWRSLGASFLVVAALLALIPGLPAQESPVGGQPAAAGAAKDHALIRLRLRDYEAVLDADHAAGLRQWRAGFLTRRKVAISDTITRLLGTGARLRATRNLDAGGLVSSPEFRSFLEREVQSQLQAQELRQELIEWAKGVEATTRSRMIECFQQIIAEDLGRVFDEHLSNQVVKAVRAIPLETILAKEKPEVRITEAILAGLPKDALSSAERKTVATASGFLAGTGLKLLTVDKLGPPLATAIGGAAGLGVEKASEFLLARLNDSLTAKPDPVQLAADYEQALLNWNDGTLKPRLEGVLAEFRRAVVAQIESQAREVNRLLLP